MIETQTFDKYAVFGENAVKATPDAVKYASGFKQADVLPAEWLNWAWHKNSKCITDLNTGLAVVEDELNAVISEDGKEADGSKGQVIDAIKNIIKKAVDTIVNGVVDLQKLTVAGNIIQKGNGKAQLSNVYIKNNIVSVRDGVSGMLNNNEIAGLKANKCDGEKDYTIGFDKNGTARAGNNNGTLPITLRSEDAEMENGAAIIWNANKRQIETEKHLSIAVSQNIGKIDCNKTITITASEQIILTIGGGSYAGIEVKIINTTDETHTIRCTSARDGDSILQAKQIQTIIWNGSKWEGLSCPRIGEVYVQYPQQTSPTDLFVCTKWKLQEQYAGAFFRATGGNSAAFIEKTGELIVQQDATAVKGLSVTRSNNLKGSFLPKGSSNFLLGDSATTEGVFSKGYVGNGHLFADSESSYNVYQINLDANHQHELSGDKETRPHNYTVKLWLRTA